MVTPNRKLDLLAHSAPHKSPVNRRLIQAIEAHDGITIHDLDEEDPAFPIDARREQQLLLQRDISVFQHPFCCCSNPEILKERQDLVLDHGFAYGQGGTALNGKAFLGGLAEAYCRPRTAAGGWCPYRPAAGAVGRRSRKGLQVVELAQKQFPQLRILARAADRRIPMP
jgi:hypothetical protein